MVELLVVMTIIVILVALIAPPAARILDGLSVTSAGQAIQNELALDRQLAISRNLPVEVQFFELPEQVGGQLRFSGYQAWIYAANGIDKTALNKIIKLPNGVILDATPSTGGTPSICSSTLIDSAAVSGTQAIPSLGNAAYKYRSFRFNGNGGTDLAVSGPTNSASAGSNDTWYLTARRSNDPATDSTPSKNYYVIQLDPLTGQTKAFRP